MPDKTKERSAIDIIYELNDKVDLLTKKIEVLDANMRLANNKLAKFSKVLNVIGEIQSAKNPGVKTLPSERIVPSGKEGGLVLGKIKTFGRVVARGQKPIKDVLIKVYNESGDIIKTRQTDSDGYWDVRLPPGKFGIEYIHKNFKTINLTIELSNDIEEFEVK